MPPKKIVDRSKVLDAAWELFCKKGLDAVDARGVAAMLRTSTHPIFDAYPGGMAALKADLVARAWALYAECIRAGAQCEKPYLGTGLAYVRFAREHTNAFRALFLTQTGGGIDNDPTREFVHDLAGETADVDDGTAQLVQLELWAVVHGLATLAVTGVYSADDALVETVLTDCFSGLKLHHGSKQCKRS